MATYLITGANRGLGLEFARQLTKRGDDVIATCRDPDQASELESLGVRMERVDVADEASVLALADRLGGAPIDVLVNNAGVQQLDMTLDKVDPEVMLDVFRINAVGPVLVTRAFLDNLRAGERRLVFNVSTNLASIANNGPDKAGGWYAYRASKAALNMLTVNLAHELQEDGFCMVAVHPGWVKTDMGGPNAPVTQPESIAGMLGVIDQLDAKDTGRFMDYQGRPMPW